MSLIINPYSFGGAPPTLTNGVWFGKNGVWQNSGNPATGANPAFTGISGTYYATCGIYRTTAPTHQVTGNFVLGDMVYAPPSGFTSIGGAFNPADTDASIALSNSDRTATKTSGETARLTRGTQGKNSGGWYFEFLVDGSATSPFQSHGISTTAETSYPGVRSDSYGYYQNTGEKYNSNILTAYGTAYTTGDVIMVAFAF